MKQFSDRIQLEKQDDTITLSIPAVYKPEKQQWLFAWILLWTVCGIVMLSQFWGDHPQENFVTFLIVWTGFWFYFEYKVIYAFRWRKWGKEVLRLSENKLTLQRQIGKRGMPRHYSLDYIKNIRVFKDTSNSFFKVMNNSYWVVSGETLAFDYQGKTVVFGLELSEADAQVFCKWLKYNIDQRKQD